MLATSLTKTSPSCCSSRRISSILTGLFWFSLVERSSEDVLPAERFDKMLGPDVRKMLANQLESDGEPCRIKGRTFSKSFKFPTEV